jgi:hypothetical protein
MQARRLVLLGPHALLDAERALGIALEGFERGRVRCGCFRSLGLALLFVGGIALVMLRLRESWPRWLVILLPVVGELGQATPPNPSIYLSADPGRKLRGQATFLV